MAEHEKMPEMQIEARQRLRTAGLRPTRQRLALAGLLCSMGGRHVTAEQLHGEAHGHGISVSLATVYNTLHQFTRAGLLRELVVGAGRSYFDTNTSPHHHFFIEGTNTLQDVPGDSVTISDLPPPPKGTAVSRVDIVIRVKDKAE
jgi:Fur family iron response transcriptional regulator